jgi:hypothetical protein
VRTRAPQVESAASDCAVRRDARRLRILAIVAFGVAAAVVVVGLLETSLPPILPIALFGVTMAVAEHRDRLFGDETSVSGSIAVAMATILVFAPGSWLAGPMICASLAGCYWPHIRARAWSRVAINAAAMSLAAAGAAAIVHAFLKTQAFDLRLAVVGCVAVAVFWICNSVVLAAAVATIQQRRPFAIAWRLVKSDVGLLPFAYMGFLSGVLAAGGGTVNAWLALLAILVLLDRIVIRASERTALAPLLWTAGLIGIASLGIVIAMASGSTASTALPLLCSGGLIAFAMADEMQPGLGLGVQVAATVAAAIVLRGTQPIVGPLLVGVTTPLTALVQCRTGRAALREATSAVVASIAIAVCALFYGADTGASLLRSLTLGVLAAGVAAVAWHAMQLMWLTVEGKRRLYRSAIDVFVADLPVALIGGVLGALAGWGCYGYGARDVVIATVLALLAARSIASLLDDAHHKRQTTSDDLLDLVRSAVLDLPASRLTDEMPDGSRGAR